MCWLGDWLDPLIITNTPPNPPQNNQKGGHGLHGHVTTFEAAVHGFGSVKELIRVRRELKRKSVIACMCFLGGVVCGWMTPNGGNEIEVG